LSWTIVVPQIATFRNSCVRRFRQGQPVAGQSHSGRDSKAETPVRRLALGVATQHAALLASLRQELGDGEAFAVAAQRLAEEFGSVTATALAAVAGGPAAEPPAAPAPGPPATEPLAPPAAGADTVAPLEALRSDPLAEPEPAADEEQELASLYRPGHMRRRLDQLVETNRRYGHPFGVAVFDASGPDARNGGDGGRETVLAILGAALRDSIRIVDEAFRLEEDAICVLAPNLGTVEGVQMAERLLGQLDDLERAGGLRIAVAAGVVACPDHGADADQLLHRADAALWRARAVGQPVGVGALDPVQDR
jgi:diguanylate cyclase (GGDEF)-like protein